MGIGFAVNGIEGLRFRGNEVDVRTSPWSTPALINQKENN